MGKSSPGIDIIVGGHSHALLHNGRAPAVAGGHRDKVWGAYPEFVRSFRSDQAVPVVQAGWGSRYVGSLTVGFDSAGNLVSAEGNTILLGGEGSGNEVRMNGSLRGLIESWEN